jgi:quaternary ammonium compound-resistance protein SugE
MARSEGQAYGNWRHDQSCSPRLEPTALSDDTEAENTRGEGAMAWIYLVVAGVFEVGWAIGLKYTEGFSRLWPSVWTVAAMIVSFILLSLALKALPIGTAYAVWTGIGAVGTVIVGIFLFNESADWLRLGCIALIVAGIGGLKLVTPV